MLQSTQIDLTKAVELIATLRQILEDYCSETYFDELWNEVLATCENSDISTTHTYKRARQITQRLQGTVIMSTLGQHTESDSKRSFITKVFNPIIDCMVGEMRRRLSSVNCDIMQGVQALNPSSSSFLNKEAIFYEQMHMGQL